jgi:hypothetical protein
MSYYDRDDITAGITIQAQWDKTLKEVLSKLKTTPKDVLSGGGCSCGEYAACSHPGPSYASNWVYDKLKRQLKELMSMSFCSCGRHLEHSFSFCPSCGSNRQAAAQRWHSSCQDWDPSKAFCSSCGKESLPKLTQ